MDANSLVAAAAWPNGFTAGLVEHVPVASIRPNPKNPRKHSKKQVAQIAASIKNFGFNVPLLVDAERQIIAGHGRLLAAQQLGFTDVPTIALTHLTAAQARAFMISDNRLTENATWDEDLLLEHFEALQSVELDFEITDTGFAHAEIDWLRESHRRRNVALPSPEPEWSEGSAITQTGDLWLLGEHRLLCGDARLPDAYDVLMAGRKAAMVFADVPYNVKIDGHAGGKGEIHHREFAMASGEMSVAQFTDFLRTVCSLMAKATVNGAIHFICMDWRHIRELLDATEGIYSECKNMCVWTKDAAGMGSLYRSQHELVFVFKHGSDSHINNVELGRHGRNRSNVWRYPGANSFGRQTDEGNVLQMHPTVKPIDLVADAILDCSYRQGVILDPFVGSGTTILAAERTGRAAYCIEIDPRYVDTAIRRWQAATGQVARHATSGARFRDVLLEERAHEIKL